MTNKTDIFNLRIGSPLRQLYVDQIQVKNITTPDGATSKKVVFYTREESTGNVFEISDTYVQKPDGSLQIRGLWLSLIDGAISAGSALAKVISYYKVEQLADLQGMYIYAYPDSEDYLVLTACDMPSNNLKQSIKHEASISSPSATAI